MDKIPFVDGTKTQEAYVTINEQNYSVTPAVWTGTTPVSALNLNNMQNNIEEAIGILEGAIDILEESINSTGLVEGRLPTLNNVELNTLEAFNGFRYIVGCTVNGETITNGYFLQLIYTETTYRIQIHIGAASGKIRYRIMNAGIWEDFASIGKQITVGQEEPTSEFIGNKRVYVKRLDIGNLPNATVKSVDHGLSNVKIERLEGVATNNGLQALPLPFASEQDVSSSIRLQSWGSYVSVYTGRDRSEFTGVVDIYYTKN